MQTQNAIEPDKGRHAHVCGAMDPYATAGVAIHRVKERYQVSFRRCAELHRYVDIIEAERSYRSSLIAQRVAWIVVQREIKYDVVARGRDRAKLLFGRLAGRGQVRRSLTKVVHVVDRHDLTNEANRPRADAAPAPPTRRPVEREVRPHWFR